jgi:hypothetical protein
VPARHEAVFSAGLSPLLCAVGVQSQHAPVQVPKDAVVASILLAFCMCCWMCGCCSHPAPAGSTQQADACARSICRVLDTNRMHTGTTDVALHPTLTCCNRRSSRCLCSAESCAQNHSAHRNSTSAALLGSMVVAAARSSASLARMASEMSLRCTL